MTDKVKVIDGGFATQLSVHVGESVDGDPLWSARFNATDPSAVIDSHYDFLKAGADAILTNTYQASVEGYMQYLGLEYEESIDLIKSTVKYAHIARKKYLKEVGNLPKAEIPLIVASIGPYGAHLHDGSEYTGLYADFVDVSILQEWHRTRINACISAGVDALAIETIPCRLEADALFELIAKEYPGIKFWISFQCKDGSRIARGENFSEVVTDLWNKAKNRKMDNLLAIGANCLHPKFVAPLFKSVNGNRAPADRIPLIVYPNSGEVYDVKAGWGGQECCIPLEYYVAEWVELGAKYIGGCCRTNAKDIKRIKDTVQGLECGDMRI